MKYAILIYSGDDMGPTPGSPEQAAEMQEWFAYTEALHAVAEALLSRESLDGEEIALLAQGKSLPEVKLPGDEYPQGTGPSGPEEDAELEASPPEAPTLPSLDEGQPAEG